MDYKTSKTEPSTTHADRIKPYNDPRYRPTNPPQGQDPVQQPVQNQPDNDVDPGPTQAPPQGGDANNANKDAPQQDGQDPENQVYHPLPPVKKIIQMSGKGGKWCKVRFKDTKFGPRWVQQDLLPQDMVIDFKLTRTMSGKRRKQKSKKK